MLIPLLSAAICWIGQQLAARFTNVWHNFLWTDNVTACALCLYLCVQGAYLCKCVCVLVCANGLHVCVFSMHICVHAVRDVGDCSVGMCVCVKCMLCVILFCTVSIVCWACILQLCKDVSKFVK